MKTEVYVLDTIKSSLAQAKKMGGDEWAKMPIAYEVFMGNQKCRPYFDFDYYIDANEESSHTANLLHSNNIKSLNTFLKQLYNGPIDNNKIAVSSLHGKVLHENKWKYKVSNHYVDNNGLLIEPIELKKKMEQYDLFDIFDSKIYSNGQQKFRLPTSKKSENDTRIPHIIHGTLEQFQISANQDLQNIKTPEKTIKIKKKSSSKKTKKNIQTNCKYMKDKDEIIKLLDIIPSKEYDIWLKVGFFLKQFGAEGFKLWNDWSNKTYIEDRSDKWASFSDESPITIGTLKKFATEADFDKYIEVFGKDIEKLTNFFFSGEDVIFANYLIEVEKITDKIKAIGKKGEYLVYDENKKLWQNDNIDPLTKIGCDILCDRLGTIVIPYHRKKLQALSLEFENNKSQETDLKEKIIKLEKLLLRLNKQSVRKSITSALKCDQRMRDDKFLFNLTKHKNLLAINDKVVDLKNGNMRERQSSDYQVNTIDIDFDEYDPDLGETKWSKFVLDILGDNKDMYNYLHKMFGYFITKETSEAVALFLIGCGSNGKSLLSNCIFSVLGSKNCPRVPSLIFDANQKSNANSASPQEAELFNACFGNINETNEDLRLDSKFKDLVDSGGVEKARHLHGDLFEFEKTAKFLFTTNNIPKFPADKAFARRIKIAPFDQTYSRPTEMKPGDKPINLNLQKELLQNKDEILNWLIEGAIKWYAQGLGDAPKEMEAEMQMEMENNDWYGQYFKYVDDWKVTLKTQEIKDILISINEIQKGKNLTSRIIKLLQKEGHVRSGDKMKWHHIALVDQDSDEDED